MATKTQTCRGGVWRLPHSDKSYGGVAAKEYEVREIPEKGIVVILAQDGLRDCCKSHAHGKEVMADAEKLLQRRWEVDLMEAIVGSPEFTSGDYEASFEAGFKRVDAHVEELALKMSHQYVEWSEPVAWSAFYNSFVVVVTPEVVYMGGGGGFRLSRIGNDGVHRISAKENGAPAFAKVYMAAGQFCGSEGLVGTVDAWLEAADDATPRNCYKEFDLFRCDHCLVLELWSPCARCAGGDAFLTQYQETRDWGAAFTDVTTNVLDPGMVYNGVLLELEHPPEEPYPCSTCQVPASVPSLPLPAAAPLVELLPEEPLAAPVVDLLPDDFKVPLSLPQQSSQNWQATDDQGQGDSDAQLRLG